jgi:hypothetical protein
MGKNGLERDRCNVFPDVTAHLVEAALEGIVAPDDFDFDAQGIDRQRAFPDPRKADRILFRRDDGPRTARLASLEHLRHFAFAEAVMVRVSPGVDQLGAKFLQPLLEAFGPRYARDGPDA